MSLISALPSPKCLTLDTLLNSSFLNYKLKKAGNFHPRFLPSLSSVRFKSQDMGTTKSKGQKLEVKQGSTESPNEPQTKSA